MNHQIYSDSFLLTNIETASHELARIKHFAKIDPKSTYPQEIDVKFKEIIINSSIGLPRWIRLPFGIKTLRPIFQGVNKSFIV